MKAKIKMNEITQRNKYMLTTTTTKKQIKNEIILVEHRTISSMKQENMFLKETVENKECSQKLNLFQQKKKIETKLG